jgi:hypothetical protein
VWAPRAAALTAAVNMSRAVFQSGTGAAPPSGRTQRGATG